MAHSMSPRNGQAGFVESFIYLWIVVALMLFSWPVVSILKKKIVLEKYAWARSFIQEVRSADLSWAESTSGKCSKEAMGLGSPLPKAFTAFLLKSCGQRRIYKHVDPSVSISTDGYESGDSFYESKLLKQALWQENMQRAGFGAIPLQFLGYHELIEASGVLGFDLGGP